MASDGSAGVNAATCCPSVDEGVTASGRTEGETVALGRTTDGLLDVVALAASGGADTWDGVGRAAAIVGAAVGPLGRTGRTRAVWVARTAVAVEGASRSAPLGRAAVAELACGSVGPGRFGVGRDGAGGFFSVADGSMRVAADDTVPEAVAVGADVSGATAATLFDDTVGRTGVSDEGPAVAGSEIVTDCGSARDIRPDPWSVATGATGTFVAVGGGADSGPGDVTGTGSALDNRFGWLPAESDAAGTGATCPPVPFSAGSRRVRLSVSRASSRLADVGGGIADAGRAAETGSVLATEDVAAFATGAGRTAATRSGELGATEEDGRVPVARSNCRSIRSTVIGPGVALEDGNKPIKTTNAAACRSRETPIATLHTGRDMVAWGRKKHLRVTLGRLGLFSHGHQGNATRTVCPQCLNDGEKPAGRQASVRQDVQLGQCDRGRSVRFIVRA